METWEPQIRTNLQHPVYSEELDGVLSRTPGLRGAGVLGLRFGEGCYRTAVGEAAAGEVLERTIALGIGLFGGGEFPIPDAFGAAAAEIGDCDHAYLLADQEAIVVQRVPGGGRTVVMTVSSRLSLAFCNTVISNVAQGIHGGGQTLEELLAEYRDVIAAILIDEGSGKILERYTRPGKPSRIALDDTMAVTVRALVSDEGPVHGLRFFYDDGAPVEITSAEIVKADESFCWTRIAFDPEHLVFLRADQSASRALIWIALRNTGTETLRRWVDGLLEYGIPSTMEPFPKTQDEFLEIVSELNELHDNDLLGRLDIGGFANHPVEIDHEEQRCQECIYYLPHRKWCDLPELPVPVEAHWWCRLWKL